MEMVEEGGGSGGGSGRAEFIEMSALNLFESRASLKD